MGAKYIPSIKDLKANARFQQKQNPQRKFKKAPPKKSKTRPSVRPLPAVESGRHVRQVEPSQAGRRQRPCTCLAAPELTDPPSDGCGIRRFLGNP